jgi:hypothetical protein
MLIPIKMILKAHEARTGEVISLNALAREMVAKGLFRSFGSARGVITYNKCGRAKSADYELIKFLMTRFDIKSMDEIIEQ